MFKDLLPPLVGGFTANILAYAVLLAAIATIIMALLELTKALLHLRLFYHRYMISKWLNDDQRYNELLILAVGEKDDSSMLFDQPTDKLMGQIQAVANVVMDFPHLYPALYEFLTHIPQAGSSLSGEKADSKIWSEFSRHVSSLQERDKQELQLATQARARLDHFVARKLDAFQTKTEYKWARLNQLVSVVGSAIFICALLVKLEESKAVKGDYSASQIFLLSAFGGMLAPFAKDVVSALSNLRAK
jgi:hypothetical protein